MRVRLYYQCSGDMPVWDFCAHAAFGARQNQVPAIKFETIESVPTDDHVVVVGSVEECSRWLLKAGFQVPTEIDITPTLPREASSIEDVLARVAAGETLFLKPKGQIKAFTGEVVTDKTAQYVLEGYSGEVWVYQPVEFVSEWRCYINKGNVMKICNYKGDPMLFPDKDIMFQYYAHSSETIPYLAYTLDFGVLKDGRTVCIEGNDAWAIGNYGLDGDLYWKFVKDRWLQITGVIK